tara:strand:- start:815 stop:1087 length:273 start_codon:yes stop_codon:yes gene_type:complete
MMKTILGRLPASPAALPAMGKKSKGKSPVRIRMIFFMLGIKEERAVDSRFLLLPYTKREARFPFRGEAGLFRSLEQYLQLDDLRLQTSRL